MQIQISSRFPIRIYTPRGGNKCFYSLLERDLLSKEIMQTRSHKSRRPSKKWPTIYQVYQVPVNCFLNKFHSDIFFCLFVCFFVVVFFSCCFFVTVFTLYIQIVWSKQTVQTDLKLLLTAVTTQYTVRCLQHHFLDPSQSVQMHLFQTLELI